MLLLPAGVEFPPPTEIEQFLSFFVEYLMVLACTSLLLPRPWFIALMKIAFPFLPENLQENNND